VLPVQKLFFWGGGGGGGEGGGGTVLLLDVMYDNQLHLRACAVVENFQLYEKSK